MSIVQAGGKSRLGDLNSENIDHEKGKRHDGTTTRRGVTNSKSRLVVILDVII